MLQINLSCFFRWLSHLNAFSGFLDEAFALLAQKSQASSQGVKVALMIDGMAIRKHIDWDSKRQSYVGYVDHGSGVNTDSTEEATEALVFMAVAILDNWKIPIAYFLIHGLFGHSLAQLIRHALERLHEIGVSVVTLTLDGHQSNQTAVKLLGTSLKGVVRSSFPHPSDSSQEVLVIFDACHMLKLVRNALNAYGKLFAVI